MGPAALQLGQELGEGCSASPRPGFSLGITLFSHGSVSESFTAAQPT